MALITKLKKQEVEEEEDEETEGEEEPKEIVASIKKSIISKPIAEDKTHKLKFAQVVEVPTQTTRVWQLKDGRVIDLEGAIEELLNLAYEIKRVVG